MNTSRVSSRTDRAIDAALWAGGLLFAGITLAYSLVVVLGATAIGERSRTSFEDLRRKTRHGTDRILSTRTIGAHLLSGLRFEFIEETIKALDGLISSILRGQGLYTLALRL